MFSTEDIFLPNITFSYSCTFKWNDTKYPNSTMW